MAPNPTKTFAGIYEAYLVEPSRKITKAWYDAWCQLVSNSNSSLVAGPNGSVQYNDNGVQAGDAHLLWDKTKQQAKILSSSGLQDSTIVAAEAGGGGHIALTPVAADSSEIEFGMVVSGGNYVPDSTSAGYIALIGSSDEIFLELDSNLSPPTPVPFTAGVGWTMTGPNGTLPAALEVYQYGGLGTGAVPGMAIGADRNDSGTGAASTIFGQLKDGRFFVFWVDNTGAPRWNVGATLASIRPTESGSVGDTSGNLFGSGSGVSMAQVAARVMIGL